ncbi:MAG: PAS domain S-box protein, partial [Ignavibacteria bacterium]|nr:PAS domain S-box protein [Ignavibacteria bacterium]
ALKESEERYSLVVDASEEGIWDWDVLTNHVYYSPQWKKQIGYEDHEIKNDFNEWIEHLHEDDKERCLNAVQEYIANPSKHFILEFRFRHKNGSYRWIHNKAASILNEEGKVVRMFGAHSDITEKKLAEESIKLSEKKFNRAFHASPVAMSIQDYQDIFRDVNDAFLHLTGYTREEVIGHTGKELRLWANSEQRKYVNELFKKHEVVRNFEFEFRRKDGSFGFGILSAELISIDGKDAALTAVLDITDRQNALEALKKSEFYLNKSQQVARIGSYLFDIKKGSWVGSKTLDEIFGIDENYNKSVEGWLSIIQPEFKQMMADHLLNHVIEGRNRFDKEYKIIRVSDGKEIWVHGIGELEFDNEGNPIFMVGTIQDITDRKNAEAALKESEEKFRTLFDTMPNGYYRSTPQGKFVDANPAFIKMLGYENLEELKKIHIPTDLYVKTIEREEILNRNPEFVSNVETYRLKRKDGSVIWVEDNARYIKDENGNVIYNEGICKDITDRKNAEDALRESEQLFNTLAQVSPVGIFRTRPDGYTTYVNPKWVR